MSAPTATLRHVFDRTFADIGKAREAPRPD
jgi:hypothetical protein